MRLGADDSRPRVRRAAPVHLASSDLAMHGAQLDAHLPRTSSTNPLARSVSLAPPLGAVGANLAILTASVIASARPCWQRRGGGSSQGPPRS